MPVGVAGVVLGALLAVAGPAGSALALPAVEPAGPQAVLSLPHATRPAVVHRAAARPAHGTVVDGAALLDARAGRLVAMQRQVARAALAAPDGVPAAPARAAAAARFAVTAIGTPYRWGAEGPDAYDCSGLTAAAWRWAGSALPHSSTAQFRTVRRVPVELRRAGDLVFFATDTARRSTVHHVGIYLGNDLMVEAPHPGAAVRLSGIWQVELIGLARP